MMALRGNWLGLWMFVFGALVAVVAGFVLKLPDQITMTSVGVSLFVADVGFRAFVGGEGNRAFGRKSGGFFFFLPVWLLGLVVAAANAMIHFKVIKK